MTADTLSTNQSASQSARIVAVIDIGASAIRMAIAEIRPSGEIHTLETLKRDVSLGKDTFMRGVISKSTMEQCVKVLKIYRRKLREYQIESADLRVAATSAVREASNRLQFIDRVFIATGIEIEPTDEAEVTRITFLGIDPLLKSEPALSSGRTLVIEVGGGSTELLLVRDGVVAFSRTYRLGSLRLRAMMRRYRAPTEAEGAIFESQIDHVIDQVVDEIPSDSDIQMIALGGDVRLAARQLHSEWDADDVCRVPVASLARFTDEVLKSSEDELVRRYQLSYPDAEGLGPALLSNLRLAQRFNLKQIFVSGVNMRDGLVKDMAGGGAWTEEFQGQVIRSALDLGEKFEFDERHGRHVAELSKTLFRALASEHQLPARFELLLYVAALLHEVGTFVNERSHHKHTMYLINNSELFGLGRRDKTLVALVARYHRRSTPKPNHEGYSSLDREGRIAVVKMAALLRLADALDHSRSQRVQNIQCSINKDQLVIAAPDVEDLAVERLSFQQKSELFEEVFGMPVQLRKGRA